MGQYTSEVLGVVGGAISAYVYGDFSSGYAIGSAVGGVIEGPTKIPAPGLAEAPVQTSRDGVPIARVWGLHYVHGNVLQKNPETQVTTTESQGKGGQGTETETTRRFRTFAIGICQGPIHDITRIWENGRLVFDARSEPAIPIEETLKYSLGIRIYYGIEDQLPNPDLEAHWGEENTPHYKGLAYIVWVNKDLTDFAGAIPQFAFEVNGSRDATVTSRPYPTEDVNGVILHQTPVIDIYSPPLEGLAITVAPEDGTIDVKIHSTDYDDEGVDGVVTPQDGSIAVKIHATDYDDEGVDPTITPQDGTIPVLVISHEYEEEGIDVTVTPQNGTLI